MEALVVVKAEVSFDARPGFRNRLVVSQVHLFLLERPPQPLNEDVVHTASPSVHTDGDVSGLQFPRELLTGELRDFGSLKWALPQFWCRFVSQDTRPKLS